MQNHPSSDSCPIALRSAHNFNTTWRQLLHAIDSHADAILESSVEHHVAASRVGVDIRPNAVALISSATLSSWFISHAPTLGLDFPWRIQVVLTPDEWVQVQYADASSLIDHVATQAYDAPLTQFAEMLRQLVADAIR